MSKFYKWTIELEVADTWVADGFDLADDDVADLLLRGPLSNAVEGEVRGRVVRAPSPAAIRREQGYPEKP